MGVLIVNLKNLIKLLVKSILIYIFKFFNLTSFGSYIDLQNSWWLSIKLIEWLWIPIWLGSLIAKSREDIFIKSIYSNEIAMKILSVNNTAN